MFYLCLEVHINSYGLTLTIISSDLWFSFLGIHVDAQFTDRVMLDDKKGVHGFPATMPIRGGTRLEPIVGLCDDTVWIQHTVLNKPPMWRNKVNWHLNWA